MLALHVAGFYNRKIYATRRDRATGRALAKSLDRWLVPAPRGTVQALRAEVLAIYTEIAALAARHLEIAIHACNRPLFACEVAESAALKTQIAMLVTILPDSVAGPLAVRFDGDPRAHTVRILVPGDEAQHHGNTWGLGGEYGV